MKAVSGKTTMPILQCILIDASSSQIKFTSNDMELGIETLVTGMILERGIVALDAKIFSEIVRKLPDNQVTIETDENLLTTITCEKAKFNIPGQSGEDFSYLPILETSDCVSISQFTLKELIRQTIFSIAANENNKLMTGELFEIKDNTLRVVSLDGHRIAIRKIELKNSYLDRKVVVPGKTLNEISKILSGEMDDQIDIYFSENHIMFKFDDTTVVSRLIDGEYFRIDQMLSSDYETKVTINKKELRLIYIEGYRRKLSKQNENNAFLFFVENNFIPLEDIAENETLFNSFISQSSFRYQCFKRHQTNTYYGVRYYYDTSEDSCNIQFSQIEKIVNSTFTYHERLEALREGEKRYREQIKILELSRNNHYATPIQELLLDVDMQTHKIFSELNVSKMLEVFLKEGLINEDYFDYISFFFGKSINKHDHDFILELKLRHSLPYDYHIDKVGQCVKNIPDKCYNDVSILNIQVVDCICQHLEEANNSKLHSIAQVIMHNKKWDFLIDFYKSVEDSSSLFNHLGSIVDGLWKIFVKQNSDELFESWLRFLELNHSTKESRNWLNKHFAFISHRVDLIGFDTIKQIVSNGKLIFTDIDAESRCLLEYVVENKAYMLTPENVVCAFVHYRNERVETLDNYPLNVTILRSCKSAKSISDYIDECFDNALNNVFITDTAKKESVGIILEIINSEDITEDTKRKYLSGQQNKVSLSDVNNIQWEFAIEVDIVIPAWPEIYAFYESQNNVMISSLRIFITKHIDELTDISELDDTQKELLAHSALLTSDFEILVYDKLVKIFDGVTFKDADINSVDNAHFKSLLCADMLPYSTYYTTTIRDNHSDVLTYYVDKYLDECIIEIEELPTDMRLYKHLMKNPRVIGEKALSVVQHFLPHIVWDNELANITLPVLKNNIEKFDYDIEKNILVASTNLPERLSFLIDLVEKFRDDFDIVTELIESLGDSYRSITDKSKKATIENNHMNEMLLGKLKTIGYISSYREDDDKLRVSHKRNH